eukprot:CAMPEP_0174231484 /NCGR_PEP_ID=MMETSP0417-20130205/2000_1 /TAXON_ID=242541 /ORGANISM="Mayorella sp, Strain BSH-02190019" /LENGTH=785 /DNA_ID=CAMNT_0015309381 /DNA_START=192 /DNA_END=2545 /DNA_ORIENTATION=+
MLRSLTTLLLLGGVLLLTTLLAASSASSSHSHGDGNGAVSSPGEEAWPLFAMTLRTQVLLIGLPEVDADTVQDIVRPLVHHLPIHSLQSGRKLRAGYSLRVSVKHSPESTLQSYYTAVAQLRPQTHLVHGVLAIPVTKPLNDVLEKAIANTGMDLDLRHTSTLILIRPNGLSVGVSLQSARPDPKYGYVFESAESRASGDEGQGERTVTASWVAKGRYAVIDLLASRDIEYGPTNLLNGAVLASSEKNPTIAELTGQVVASTVSFARYLLASDLAHDDPASLSTVSTAPLLLPLVAFRDHVEFDPWREDIRVEAVADLLRRALSPAGVQVRVVEGLHGLHEHRHVALALHRALRVDTMHRSGSVQGRYRALETPFLDSEMLLEGVVHAADPITLQLLRGAEEAHQYFATETRPHSRNSASGAPLPIGGLALAPGTRLLPIYLFSLKYAPAQMLLDRQGHRFRLGSGTAAVLHSAEPRLRLPFFRGAEPDRQKVEVRGRDATRPLLAAALQLATGISSPVERAQVGSPEQGAASGAAVDRDFRWACGAHPFGPFGTWQSSAVSWLLLDQALRNPLLLRLDAALRSIELAVSELAHFAGSYIGPEVEAQVRGWPVQLLGDLQTQRDAFAWSPTTNDPLTRALVAEGSSLRGALGSSTFSEDRRHRLQSGDLPDAAAAAAAESRLSVLASRSPVGGHWLLPAWAHWLYLSAVRAGQEHESNAVDTAIAASRDAESEALRGGGPRLATRSLSRDTPAVVVARARVQLHELAAHLRALSAALGVGELERA